MRLKKIKLLGFKSFGESTSVDFVDGITAIVGPNGCGKSNIADAFRWVLGEQSAKSLRGGRMQDVIFSGAASRKPLNFAEVSLTLTDIKGALPIDYEEITVSRRLHRSGESEYFLNKHPVRLREVQGLFLDSGIGRSAFSIFEQGKIDQVIHLSPQERRVLFEEAAGILRFLQRKSEALRKLEQTDLNLQRAQDIHGEVERQIVVLEKQAEEARLYQQQKERFAALDKSLILHKLQQATHQLTQLTESERDCEGQVKALQLHLDTRLLERQDLDVALAGKVREFNEHREEILRTEGARNVSVGASAHASQRLQEILVNENRWQAEISEMQQKSASRVAEKQLAEQQLAELDRQLQESTVALEEVRRQVQKGDDEVGKLRMEQAKVSSARLKQVQEEGRLQGELTQTTMRFHQAQASRAAVEKREAHLRQQLEELQQSALDKKQQMENATLSVDSCKSTLGECEIQLREFSEKIRLAQQQLDIQVRAVADWKGREGALLRLRQDLEGFSKGSQILLQESSREKSALYGKLQPLYSQIVPQTGFALAVAAILRAYHHALVVETLQDMEAVLAFARQHRLTDFALVCLEMLEVRQDAVGLLGLQQLPLNNVQEPQNGVTEISPGKGSPDRGNASLGKKFQRELLLGLPLLSTGVNDSLLARHFTGQASVTADGEALFTLMKQIPGGLVCSCDGYLWDSHQVLTSPVQGGSDPFLREVELRTLSQQRQEGEDGCALLEEAVRNLRQKRDVAQQERGVIDGELRRLEMKLVEVNFSLQRAHSELGRARKEQEQLDRDGVAADREIEGFAANLEQLQARLDQQLTVHALGAQELTELEANLAHLSGRLQQQHVDVRQLESAHGRLMDQQRKLTYGLSLLAVKEHEAKIHQKRLETEMRAGQALSSRLQQEQAEQQNKVDELEARLLAMQEKQRDLELALGDRRKKMSEISVDVDRQQSQLRKREKEFAQLRLQIAETGAYRAALTSEFADRYRESDGQGDASSCALPCSISEAEHQLRLLRISLDKQQNVNMTSIEEYDKQRERYRFLTEQMGDLVAAKLELNGIIAQLDGECRQLFNTTFAAIRANFRKNFQILFEGGEADLQLAEGVGILEAGIEIVAKPPGKQLRSIQLLSGGEKCLTALALLFALFEVKPAPFCVLDEIDAPLDEANVGRFVHMVKHFVDRCQFIIITHNKTTMAIADVLVGVSMQEKGVSRVVSLTFAKEGQQGLMLPMVAI